MKSGSGGKDGESHDLNFKLLQDHTGRECFRGVSRRIENNVCTSFSNKESE